MKTRIILCDIDGVIADINHRLHYIDGVIIPMTCTNCGSRNKYRCNICRYWDCIEHDQSINHGKGIKNKGCLSDTPFSNIKTGKNYDAFYAAAVNDKPILWRWRLIKLLAWVTRSEIMFSTGRPDIIRKTTIQWISDNIHKQFSVEHSHYLWMRKNEDRRHASEVKREHIEWIKKAPHANPWFLIDDDPKNIEMAKSEGLYTWFVKRK